MPYPIQRNSSNPSLISPVPQSISGATFLHLDRMPDPWAKKSTPDSNFSPSQHRSSTHSSGIPEIKTFDLGLGLADPTLREAPLHIAYGSLNGPSDSLPSVNTHATHAHPSLMIHPTHTVASQSSQSRFRQLFQKKMAAEALQSNPSANENRSTQAHPQLPLWQDHQPFQHAYETKDTKLGIQPPSNGVYNPTPVHNAGTIEDRDLTPRPATSDGVVLSRLSPLSSEGHKLPVSASATLPEVSSYRPQPQQSAHYQRMLAAKLSSRDTRPDHRASTSDAGMVPPAITASDLNYIPSTYSPMYQMFSQGGGALDSQYQARHAPDQQPQSWMGTPRATTSFVPSPPNGNSNYIAPGGSSWLNQPLTSRTGPSTSTTSWDRAPLPSSYPQTDNGYNASQGPVDSWSRDQHRPDDLPHSQGPPYSEWMDTWTHNIKGPQDENKPPQHYSKSQRGRAPKSDPASHYGSPPTSSKNGHSNRHEGDGAQDKGEPLKKAALACHFCRGRKLKCDAIRPACSHCVKRNLCCSYDAEIRRRGPGKRKKESMAQQQEQATGEYDHSDDDDRTQYKSAGSNDRLLHEPPTDPEPSETAHSHLYSQSYHSGSSTNYGQDVYSRGDPYQYTPNMHYSQPEIPHYQSGGYQTSSYPQHYDSNTADRYRSISGSGSYSMVPSHSESMPGYIREGGLEDGRSSKRLKMGS